MALSTGAPDVSGGPLSGLRVTGMRVVPPRTWMRVPTGVWVQALTTAQITTAPTAASVWNRAPQAMPVAMARR
ncbi:hypothetical protein ABWJ92_11660 [Streptomyces sp. NPDC000609]|uniref:hypothetical protein n=1 Tax=Streptomyces sp. NPDC000609 TaxID=3160957 RepID=UPI003396FCB0